MSDGEGLSGRRPGGPFAVDTPDWYGDVLAHPMVRVELDGETFAAVAVPDAPVEPVCPRLRRSPGRLPRPRLSDAGDGCVGVLNCAGLEVLSCV
ncbi:hypothetical protein QCN29_19365 [Streptomyces sp. HNM0663]|uniref:Uncharacterized protein n=1 Tax=Streptomyces chengmaiensis TaxID=3040919 RepID=A0ABT6HQB6_9ACTN|nr:hypothetical protein [Streptomyces chengmaiensis]MDH2390911.1 hypothetical protein [Streptomyces chengmaiensis]